ncbi:MAG: dTDP-glucose 4,6-dehydratase [Candidatus Pacebacteria bacterium]|jgi:dTDP-glucose 4,6-dehydratase|nr:dTDP-glucose 4,6-dehydratase [Candidatus Paceibacterota bacterium]MBT6756018.1 dTDP-glucose 4,6-dehydratase [Candidatus Paceibacterota bacterium]MBT6920794.1 dTDP-glucose 4,6-dehydratase [Candidatus Paceibacterota bacterium]
MAQTLLVTGGAGFIGSNFILYWLKNHPEDSIINLDYLTYAGNLENLTSVENNANYTFIHGDIGNKQLVNKIMDDVDTVVHFAAESHVDRSIKNPEIFLETNIIGTQVLLEAALTHKIKRFHHISTDEVFGALELNTLEKFSDDTAYNPHSPYSASKAASDHLVRAYGTTYGLPYTITNCSNNYGEYQFPEKFIPLTIANLMEDKDIPVYGDGLYVRDWLYVQDHCTAIDKVLQNGKLGETYLIGGLTKDISNLEISKMILNLMGKSEDHIKYVTDRPGHDRRYAVDWTKINKELGWSPSVSLEEGIQKTIDWYTSNAQWWKKLRDTNKQYFEEQYKK